MNKTVLLSLIASRSVSPADAQHIIDAAVPVKQECMEHGHKAEKGAENMKETFSVSATKKPVSPESASGFRRDRVKKPEETVSASLKAGLESVKMTSGSGEMEEIDRFTESFLKEIKNVSFMVFPSIRTGSNAQNCPARSITV